MQGLGSGFFQILAIGGEKASEILRMLFGSVCNASFTVLAMRCLV